MPPVCPPPVLSNLACHGGGRSTVLACLLSLACLLGLFFLLARLFLSMWGTANVEPHTQEVFGVPLLGSFLSKHLLGVSVLLRDRRSAKQSRRKEREGQRYTAGERERRRETKDSREVCVWWGHLKRRVCVSVGRGTRRKPTERYHMTALPLLYLKNLGKSVTAAVKSISQAQQRSAWHLCRTFSRTAAVGSVPSSSGLTRECSTTHSSSFLPKVVS